MTVFKEFKEFAVRGNMVDLAVGIVIGSAFTGIVNSIVKDVIMPPIGLLLGKVNFNDLFVVLEPRGKTFNTLDQAQKAGAVTLNYGVFLNAVVSFVIVAFAVFMLVRVINRLRREPETPQTKACPFCTTGIPIAATRCPQCTADLPV